MRECSDTQRPRDKAHIRVRHHFPVGLCKASMSLFLCSNSNACVRSNVSSKLSALVKSKPASVSAAMKASCFVRWRSPRRIHSSVLASWARNASSSIKRPYHGGVRWRWLAMRGASPPYHGGGGSGRGAVDRSKRRWNLVGPSAPASKLPCPHSPTPGEAVSPRLDPMRLLAASWQRFGTLVCKTFAQ
jgi:hypothetical protein